MKRETPRKWTPVEDEIFLEIMSKVVKARMWDAVKEDGRLGYRGAPGIAAHVAAIVCDLYSATSKMYCTSSDVWEWLTIDEQTQEIVRLSPARSTREDRMEEASKLCNEYAYSVQYTPLVPDRVRGSHLKST